MILIHEIETVVLLTPRTGTGALRRAVAQRYPRSMLLYRHMEADGVPQGYDRWRKVGVVRNPVDRLWSLYKYLKRFGMDFAEKSHQEYTTSLRESVDRPFEDWLIHNEKPFSTPYDSSGQGRFFPFFTVRHPMPENRKSQYHHLRPDLGTKIYRYDEVQQLHAALDVAPEAVNVTDRSPPPPLSQAGLDYVARWFAWDLQASQKTEPGMALTGDNPPARKEWLDVVP